MQGYILALIFTPLVFAIILPFNSVRVRNIVTYSAVFFLSLLSIGVFFQTDIIRLEFSHLLHNLFIAADIILLLFFIFVGLKKKNNLVTSLALVQSALFCYFLFQDPFISSSDIVVDKISSIMLLVVNIVGGIIIIYSLRYIDTEEFKQCRKNAFIAILFFFVAVMNLIVTTNNLEIFFLAFELTTLCSYLLIKYRGDELSVTNALRALWMNQVGGVAILVSLIVSVAVYDTLYFDILLARVDDMFLLAIVFLAVAAFVKGASIPFDKWLLGAMVAPTPVSAILHSATMVKIAPYLILKISPAFSPSVSMLVMIFGSFIFMSASMLALSKDYFKEILGLSTIALLALMMSIASINDPRAVDICLTLIVFHAISKALLFLQAGILEKQYHLKYLKDINYLVANSKLVVFFILTGFASLTLPPFGAFVGKLASIELVASLIEDNILYVFALVFILLGSVFLTLLYFKVVTKLLAVSKNTETSKQKIPLSYILTSFSLIGLLLFGIYTIYKVGLLSLEEALIPAVIIASTLFMLYFVKLKNAHLVKEYNCGEKDSVSLSAYYFNIDEKYKKIIVFISISLMILILTAGI